jgi:hypothetical protein
MIEIMRCIIVSLLVLLAGCNTNPAKLGITGAANSTPPPDPGATQTDVPVVPQSGLQLAPSVPANTGTGKFWGYN